MTDTNNDNEYFSGGDFVFTQDSDKNIVGGGYKITTGDIITKIVRIIPKNNENLEDYENKKL